jgi:anti-anti-sigma factor
MSSGKTIQLDAELTIAQVEVWNARLTDEAFSANEVMIDASALVRIDTAGLQLLWAFSRSCASRNVTVVLFNVPKTLQELIRVSGLSQELG